MGFLQELTEGGLGLLTLFYWGRGLDKFTPKFSKESEMFDLLFDPGLQFVHFPVELLQVFGSAQRPRLIGCRLFQALPLVPELSELFLHQLRGRVQFTDQLLAHL